MEKRQHKDFVKFPPILSSQNVRCSHVNSGSTAAGRCVAGSAGVSQSGHNLWLRRCWNNRKCGASERRFPNTKEDLIKLSAVSVLAYPECLSAPF
jgi:hypothetical protein